MTIRMTQKRQVILDYLQKHHGTHSAAAIHAALPNIDLVTIYRTLEVFTKEKIIKQFRLTSGEAEYEYQSTPHHHAVCTDCDRVIHFEASDARIKKLLKLRNFNPEEIELTIKGTCEKH